MKNLALLVAAVTLTACASPNYQNAKDIEGLAPVVNQSSTKPAKEVMRCVKLKMAQAIPLNEVQDDNGDLLLFTPDMMLPSADKVIFVLRIADAKSGSFVRLETPRGSTVGPVRNLVSSATKECV